MKITNKKGFGLVMAIMIITILLIMAAGFFQLTDYSSRSVNSNIKSLSMYWAAESASNYSVNWWINLPDTTRKVWPNSYTPPSSVTIYSDLDAIIVDAADFAEADGTAEGNVMYLHQSSLIEGNAGTENPELNDLDGVKLFTVRYKGPRAGEPDQAVWILDSYAWDPTTNDISNVVLANVYNYISTNSGVFINSELINATLLGLTGFRGVKGRFNEQDIRYGQCYFADIVHFDYKTGPSKEGPKFYGLVKSASDDVSMWKNDTNFFTDLSSDYAYGLLLNSSKITNQSEAEEYAAYTLRGGYEKRITPYDLDYVVWSWDDIVEFGPENGLYNLDIEGLFGAGNAIGVELVTTEVVPGSPVTTCKLSKNGSFVKDLPIGNFAGGYSGVAVPEKYGTVSIKGVSAKDFSLITEKDQVLVTDDFYLWEMRDVKAELEAGYSDVIDPDEATLEWLWDEMLAKNPEGHLAVIAGLGVTVYDKDWPPIYLPNETLIFSNASYLTQMGELGAKGTGQTDLRMWNIGSVMVLNQQEIMSGPSDTAQKWPKIFIQDQRYLNPTENLPPFCGEGPSDHPSESLKSLNPNHTWSRGMKSGKTDDWRTVVWRNGSP